MSAIRDARPAAEGDRTRPLERHLAEFVAQHYPRLVRLAGLVCRDRSDAEDAVQIGLERAWRRSDSLRDPASLKAWLDRIVVREAIRLNRRGPAFLDRYFPGPREINVAPIGPSDPTATEVGRRAALRVAFDSLPPAQRAVLALHLYAGYSMGEVAEIIGIPLETARSRLRLARGRLREQLEKDSP